MVMEKNVLVILRQLEKYFIQKNKYKLSGYSYDLILIIPTVATTDIKYSWILSSQLFDNTSQKEIILDIITFLRERCPEEYKSIARINLLNSQSSDVKNLNFIYSSLPLKNEFIELNTIIGGQNFEGAVLLRSKLLTQLIEGAAVTITLNNNKVLSIVLIDINSDFVVKGYSGKALKEFFSENGKDKRLLKKMSFEQLSEMDYITTVRLDDILDIV